ncbi:hypothetical protein GCM10007967_28100 [Xylanimonas ulmi]
MRVQPDPGNCQAIHQRLSRQATDKDLCGVEVHHRTLRAAALVGLRPDLAATFTL